MSGACLRSNRIRFGAAELTYEEFVLDVIGSPAVESDAQTRFELLAAFREEAREEGVVSA